MTLETLRVLSSQSGKELFDRVQGFNKALLERVKAKPGYIRKLDVNKASLVINLIDDPKVLGEIYPLDKRVTVREAIKEHNLFRLLPHFLRCSRGCDDILAEVGVENLFEERYIDQICDEALTNYLNSIEMYSIRSNAWLKVVSLNRCIPQAYIAKALGDLDSNFSLPEFKVVGDNWQLHRSFRKAFDCLPDLPLELVDLAVRFDVDFSKWKLSSEVTTKLLLLGAYKHVVNSKYFKAEELYNYFINTSEEGQIEMLRFSESSEFLEMALSRLTLSPRLHDAAWSRVAPVLNRFPELSSTARVKLLCKTTPATVVDFITSENAVLPRPGEVKELVSNYPLGVTKLLPELRRGRVFINEAFIEFCKVAVGSVSPARDLLISRSATLVEYLNRRLSELTEDELVIFYELFESWNGSFEELLVLAKGNGLKSNATISNAVTILR